MLGLARRNQVQADGTANISFIDANITAVPLEDGIADCVISNCVINLVPEPAKPMAFAEMARLLKHGGRVALADTLARKPLTEEVKKSIALYLGCVSGASTQEQYTRYLKDAGFSGRWIYQCITDDC
jgi:ubiquinone/menaquinone biosynthesis C-methylase UbiE